MDPMHSFSRELYQVVVGGGAHDGTSVQALQLFRLITGPFQLSFFFFLFCLHLASADSPQSANVCHRPFYKDC